MGMFGGLQPQRPSIMDDPRLMQMSQVDPRDMASMLADAHARSQLPPDAAPQAPQAAPQPQFTPQPPQGGMMQQGVPAPSPHAYDAAPVIPPSVMSAPDLAGPSSQINPYDMMSMGHDAGARTANIGQQMQPAPQPQSGGGLLGGGGFLGTVGKIGGGILDILKYGPFVAEAHANQAAKAQTQQVAYSNAMTAYQNANRPTYQSSGDDLIGLPKDGSAPFVAYHGQPKSAQLAVGQHYDPTTDTVSYANGVESPAQKVARESQDASDKQDHQDAFQTAAFAHSDAAAARSQAHSDQMQTRALAAVAARQNPAAPPLPTGTIDYLAQRYNTDGSLPSFGMGKASAGMKAAVINRAVEMAAATGGTGADGATNKATFHANAGALATLSRTSGNVLASERTATMNGDQVLKTMVKGAGTTGMPVFNAWQQAGRTGLGGNADVATFNLAVQTFATEYAKVTSGASGGAVTSDSARHEMMGLINNAQTPAMLSAVIAQAKLEMGNRRIGLQQQMTEMKGQLNGSGGARSMTPAFTHTATAANGHKIGWNGSAWVPAQ